MNSRSRALLLIATLFAAPLLPAATPTATPSQAAAPATPVTAADPRVAIAAKMDA